MEMEFRRGACCGADGIDARPVPAYATFKAVKARPAAIAVHDDGNMLWQAILVQLLKKFLFGKCHLSI